MGAVNVACPGGARHPVAQVAPVNGLLIDFWISVAASTHICSATGPRKSTAGVKREVR